MVACKHRATIKSSQSLTPLAKLPTGCTGCVNLEKECLNHQNFLKLQNVQFRFKLHLIYA